MHRIQRSGEARQQGVCHIPELDHNVKGPQVKVLVLVDADLASAVDLLKVIGKCVVNAGDKVVEAGLPASHEVGDVLVEALELCAGLVQLARQALHLAGTAVKLAQHIGVSSVHKLELGLLGIAVHANLVGRPALAYAHDDAVQLRIALGHQGARLLAQLARRGPLLIDSRRRLLEGPSFGFERFHNSGVAPLQAFSVRLSLEMPHLRLQQSPVRLRDAAQRLRVLHDRLGPRHGLLVPVVLEIRHVLADATHGIFAVALLARLGFCAG